MNRPVYPGQWRGPTYMSTAEAASYLGLSPATVQRLGQEYGKTEGRMGLRRPIPGQRFLIAEEVVDYARRRVAAGYIKPILEAIRRYAHGRGVILPAMPLNFHCWAAYMDHRRHPRFFAHAFHHEWAGKNGICMVPTIATTPLATAAGVTLHEVGHVMCGERDRVKAEPAADEWVRERLGLEVRYSPATTVQYLDRRTLRLLGLLG